MSYNPWLVNVSDGITVKTVIVFIIQGVRLHFLGTHSERWGLGVWLCSAFTFHGYVLQMLSHLQ